MDPNDYDLLQCDFRETAMGLAMKIRLHRKDMAPMGWEEIAAVINTVYPGRWACQWFPPKADIVNQANKYHLFVFEEMPRGMTLREPPPEGALRCAIDYPLADP